MRKRFAEEPLGKRFGKTDLDRIGFFSDPSPAPFNEYRGPVEFREGVEKGRQILAGPPSALFEQKFVRIFDGEALNEPWRAEVEERLQREKRKIGARTMLPSSPGKMHSTPGDWHGCFDKPTYFSPELKRDRKGRIVGREPPNMKIKPNPLGGPGYADIGLSPYPSYSHDPYDREGKRRTERSLEGRFLSASAPLEYFPPNPYEDKNPGPTYVRPREIAVRIIGPTQFHTPFPKQPGGNHDGCFDKFPTYASDPYEPIKSEKKVETKAVFVSGGPPIRSKYTNSIIEQITRRSCNSTNYREYRERVYPLSK